MLIESTIRVQLSSGCHVDSERFSAEAVAVQTERFPDAVLVDAKAESHAFGFSLIICIKSKVLRKMRKLVIFTFFCLK